MLVLSMFAVGPFYKAFNAAKVVMISLKQSDHNEEHLHITIEIDVSEENPIN